MKIKEIINWVLPTRVWRIVAILLIGVISGLGLFTVYASRAWSYASDKPETCVNCHIMGTYYATWKHSSHARNTNCNDCHVPHDNVLREYYFHAMDGLRHSTIYTLRGESQTPEAISGSKEVIMENCIRCHTQLNTEFVKTGTQTYKMIEESKGMACWDCHRNVPHGGKNSLSSTPNALVPYPDAEVPSWLKDKKDKVRN